MGRATCGLFECRIWRAVNFECSSEIILSVHSNLHLRMLKIYNGANEHVKLSILGKFYLEIGNSWCR